MHLARISTAKKGFLKDMYVTNYVLANHQDQLSSYSELKEDEYTGAQSLHSACQDGMNGGGIGCGTHSNPIS